jgi:hypothetical protein
MVLTLQGSGKQLKLLATEAVSSGGGSGSGKLVPVILLTFKERERAHEPREELRGGGLGRSWRRGRSSGV